ncbi:pentapeptide repeat-containing protein [Kitasatospora sp. NPDC048722]|uniref:pentapeptide repeat-containing protein n=1 Tax=Kitasatospora sp. NPDC048722 TaxID=3155639 RepID=UPI0033DA97E7
MDIDDTDLDDTDLDDTDLDDTVLDGTDLDGTDSGEADLDETDDTDETDKGDTDIGMADIGTTDIGMADIDVVGWECGTVPPRSPSGVAVPSEDGARPPTPVGGGSAPWVFRSSAGGRTPAPRTAPGSLNVVGDPRPRRMVVLGGRGFFVDRMWR